MILSLALACASVAGPALHVLAASAPTRMDHIVRFNSLPFATSADAVKVGDSYAGHISVRKTAVYEAGLFYWYFRAESRPQNAPLVIWIQGGPGGSSIQDGLFFEMGPLRVVEHSAGNYTISRNPFTWTRNFNMLFIDQPVGTGYSYVNPPSSARLPPNMHTFWTSTLLGNHTRVHLHEGAGTRTGDMGPAQLPLTAQSLHSGMGDADDDFIEGYAANEAAVSKDFITFMQGFYDMYPELRKVDLHLTSESYGGKYVPEIATAIAKYNDALEGKGKEKAIPLRTLAIGNQWTDPTTQIGVHPEHFLQLGLIDDVQASLLAPPIAAAREAVARKDWMRALEARSEMFQMLAVFTGGINWYDFRLLNNPLPVDHIARFLELNTTRKLLHVNSPLEFGTDAAVGLNLASDNMKSTIGLFPALFKKYKVLLYQGQMDLRDGVTSNSRWIEAIDWNGRVPFKFSQRQVWMSSDAQLQGYVTQWANLTRVVLTGCGHLAPADAGCPLASLEMITRHIENNRFL